MDKACKQAAELRDNTVETIKKIVSKKKAKKSSARK